MTAPPQTIRSLSKESALEIGWGPGERFRLPHRFLRQQCPCASCVSEFTGERILDPDSVPQGVHPVALDYAGSYAIKIKWSDQHDTGIYTWERLRRLCEADEATRAEADEGA